MVAKYKEEVGTIIERLSEHPVPVLISPVLLYITLFFLVPLAWLLRVSFFPGGAFTYEPGFTLEHYLRFLTDPHYLNITAYTLKLATMVVPVVLICSYPLAYFIVFGKPKWRRIYIFALVIPMFTNEVVTGFGWQMLLRDSGVLNSLLLSLGIINKPLRLVYATPAVVVALSHSIIPYIVFILMGVFEGISKEYMEAARVLGAGRIKTFLEVTLPLSMPGVSAAIIITFMWGVGSFTFPALLGSAAERTMSIEAERQILYHFNWPFGTAIASLLIVMTLMFLVAYYRLMPRRGGGGLGG